MRTGSEIRTGDPNRPRKDGAGLRRAWCCSFGVVPRSSDTVHRRPNVPKADQKNRQQNKQIKSHHKPPLHGGSVHSSPSPSSKIGRGLIDPRRILSPGRVSPIDSDSSSTLGPLPENANVVDSVSVATTGVELEQELVSSVSKEEQREVIIPGSFSSDDVLVCGGDKDKSLDLRLALKGKSGRTLVLELDVEVLCGNSKFFKDLVLDSRKKVDDSFTGCKKIEVANIADLGLFRETIELMFEKDIVKLLMKMGVSRTIDVLEISSTIMFERGVMSCLKYLEAVPWTEGEEEKLKSLFARCTFEEKSTQDILSRLYSQGAIQSQTLALQLLHSVASGTVPSSRREMQSLVNGLLSQSSVYEKDSAGLNKDGLYSLCHSCLNSLVVIFEEASGSIVKDEPTKKDLPLIERISKQVDNLNWLLEILIDKQMAEDFVSLWANQRELLQMHETTSPMVRYELSRVSACIFIAIGKGRLQCNGELRHRVLTAWFVPILSDFGWLQRCSKGLDMRLLEEGLGQAVLTLSLKQQESIFVEWFKCFAIRGTECPNLSRAFQVWWRRSFVRPTELRTHLPKDYQNVLYEES